MNTVVTIDFDIIMAPSIELYNDKVPAISWDSLLEDPYMKLLTIDTEHYHKIFKYLMRCVSELPLEKVHFIEDHGQVVRFVNEKCQLINIDHHHDLGYDNPGLPEDKKVSPNCADWANYLHEQDLMEKYTWICNSNSLKKDKIPFWVSVKDFRDVEAEDLPIPDELIICLSEPWVPYTYRALFYLLMDFCNNHYGVHFDILRGPFIEPK